MSRSICPNGSCAWRTLIASSTHRPRLLTVRSTVASTIRPARPRTVGDGIVEVHVRTRSTGVLTISGKVTTAVSDAVLTNVTKAMRSTVVPTVTSATTSATSTTTVAREGEGHLPQRRCAARRAPGPLRAGPSPAGRARASPRPARSRRRTRRSSRNRATSAPSRGDAQADREGQPGRGPRRRAAVAATRRAGQQDERDRRRGERGRAAERRQHAEAGGVERIEAVVGDQQVDALQHREEHERHGETDRVAARSGVGAAVATSPGRSAARRHTARPA